MGAWRTGGRAEMIVELVIFLIDDTSVLLVHTLSSELPVTPISSE